MKIGDLAKACGMSVSALRYYDSQGICTSVYGDKTVSGDNMQTWTKGFVLRKFNETACAYELRCENDKDFLLIEWKSGDYIWGGLEPGCYVFTREQRI